MKTYNKKRELLKNIEAIKLAFVLSKEQRTPTPEEIEIIKSYSGFGGIKSILTPANTPSDIERWGKSELEMFAPTLELNNILRENCESETEYKLYMNSLRKSVLTAFYTPRVVVDAIVATIKESGIIPQKILEPSAGVGAFVSSIKDTISPTSEIVSFEKDILTSKLLSALHPDTKVYSGGFESISPQLNDYFDIVISNIPFGDTSVFDAEFATSKEEVHIVAKQTIHNYFFIKGVNTLRDGGLLAYITSQGVLNAPSNRVIREWLMRNTNLISVIRLPNNLFSANAGTDVGSDLIILQKNINKSVVTTDELRFIETEKRPSGVVWNSYFKNMSQIIHTSWRQSTDPYGKLAITFKHDGGAEGVAARIKRVLSEDFTKRFSMGLYTQSEEENQPTTPSIPINLIENRTHTIEEEEEPERPKPVVSSLLTLFGDVAVGQHPRRRMRQHHSREEIKKQKSAAFLAIRDAYNELYYFERNHKQQNESLRETLNSCYDSFVEKYGFLTDKKNRDVMDKEPSCKVILFLERNVDNEIIKADIFTKPVGFNSNESANVDSVDEALSSSLNIYGAVKLDYMESILTEHSSEDIIAELDGKIYFNPQQRNYEIKEKFIAGNVIAKMEDIESYLLDNPNDERAKESLKALADAQPIKIPFVDLDFNLGERWIPTSVYSEFATHLLCTDVRIRYNSSADEFIVECDGENAIINDKYCVKSSSRKYNGIHLMKSALLNTTPDITKTVLIDGKEYKVRDSEAIQMANAKIDEIRSSFSEWLAEQDDEYKQRIEDLYNRTFNCFVRPHYDGSHQKFPDLDLKRLGIPDLYQSQKDAVWMIKQRSFSKVGRNGVTYCKCG
ncbi:MAG: N-6 DNA methylase [Rikenellaceae bacterium]